MKEDNIIISSSSPLPTVIPEDSPMQEAQNGVQEKKEGSEDEAGMEGTKSEVKDDIPDSPTTSSAPPLSSTPVRDEDKVKGPAPTHEALPEAFHTTVSSLPILSPVKELKEKETEMGESTLEDPMLSCMDQLVNKAVKLTEGFGVAELDRLYTTWMASVNRCIQGGQGREELMKELEEWMEEACARHQWVTQKRGKALLKEG